MQLLLGNELTLKQPHREEMNANKLLIWAEASVTIGTGHVMRCLALAQAWKRARGAVTFLLQEGSSGVADRILGEGLSVEMLPRERERAVREIASRSGCQLVVLDGYSLGRHEQSVLRDAGIAVLFLDDYGHAEHYSARWVLNQNLHAQPEFYSRRNSDTQLLLGPAYALLREEFLPWIGWKRSIADHASKVLVTMGGSDAGNVSSRILGNLAGLVSQDVEVVLVVGSSNPHLAAVQRAVERCAVPVRMVQNARDMPALMAWADIAVAAAGGTSYELCYMGLPSILFVAAENQRGVAESLAQTGAAVNAGRTQEFEPERFAGQLRTLLQSSTQRSAMSQRGHELVDGMGAERVRMAIMGRELRFRPVQEGDCQLLFGWANDPLVRAASFHSSPISWEEHAHWFAQRLQDPQTVIYIGQNASGVAVGLVRFQLQGARAVLSVSVAPDFRGAGWGTALIAFSIRSLVRTHAIGRVDALVKHDNRASMRLFEKSGFQQVGTDRISGQLAVRFMWECKMGAHAG